MKALRDVFYSRTRVNEKNEPLLTMWSIAMLMVFTCFCFGGFHVLGTYTFNRTSLHSLVLGSIRIACAGKCAYCVSVSTLYSFLRSCVDYCVCCVVWCAA